MSGNVTRGKGLLEGFLAKQRTRMANSLIPQELRRGRILDIGCGNYPYFLTNTEFREKHGLDRIPNSAAHGALDARIRLKNFDLGIDRTLPYEDDHFEAVTMLAVLEHLEPEGIPGIIQEVHRVIRVGGIFVATTPAWWTDIILKALARLGLVSQEELDEHKNLFSPKTLLAVIAESDFKEDNMQTGYFELGMNIWVLARKQ